MSFAVWLCSENPLVTLLKSVVNISAAEFLSVIIVRRRLENSVDPCDLSAQNWHISYIWARGWTFPSYMKFLWASDMHLLPVYYYLGISRTIESDIRPKPPCCASGLMF